MIFSSKKRRTRRAIRGAAEQAGISEQKCREEMQAALDDAWANSQHDPAARAAWERYFPSGTKPSLEDFMERIAAEVRGSRGL